jgi:uncharacterized protein (TIGR00106 family)
MSVMAEFSIVPVGKGASVSPVIARVLKIVAESGISYKTNPMGTVLEGSWEEVMGLIKTCHDEVMKNAERAVTSIKIDDRAGSEKRIDSKLESVEQKLGMSLKR